MWLEHKIVKVKDHLYVLSDEPIQHNDWVYEEDFFKDIIKVSSNGEDLNTSKVIATTNTNLNLPLIPEEVVNMYTNKPNIYHIEVFYISVALLDPPDGWKYGFPKVGDVDNIYESCIDLGYPNSIAESYGGQFYVRVMGDTTRQLKLINNHIIAKL